MGVWFIVVISVAVKAAGYGDDYANHPSVPSVGFRKVIPKDGGSSEHSGDLFVQNERDHGEVFSTPEDLRGDDLRDIQPVYNPRSRTWSNVPTDPEEDDESFLLGGDASKRLFLPENPLGLKNQSALTGLYEEVLDVRETKAFFEGKNGSVVTAQLGTTAKISCVVCNRADHETVSWIRLRDHHIITIGRQTYSRDERFSVTHNRLSNEWILYLRYVQERDAGSYLCQISTHPPKVYVTTLKITVASATIAEGPERHVYEGSQVHLNCTLKHHSQPPEYVFWYHNKTMINYDANRQVSVTKTANGSVLTLLEVGRRDSGNYTCQPSNAAPASILLHIILEDNPAAMQISFCTRTLPHIYFWYIVTVVLLYQSQS